MADPFPWPPFPLDMLMRPIKIVQEPGGVFVSGDQWGFARYAKIATMTTNQNWVGITDLATASNDPWAGQIHGSSYALVDGKPTFILAGWATDFSADIAVLHAFIVASHNGTTWTTVFDESTSLTEHSEPLTMEAVVWDASVNDGKGSFYAQGFRDGAEETYRSVTGLSWGSGGGDFASHCKGKLPGQPDGAYGYDKSKDILMQINASGGIDITTAKGTESIDIDFLGAFCVAFAGGIWIAGGNTVLEGSKNTACTASSVDDGKTWVMVSKGALGMHEETGQAPSIWTVVGAPGRDFAT